jgi:hypothetical protein
MNISQLSEQLKDVPQGTLINYARDPNSVVPQFLALAEIQRRQHLQNTPQPPASTVAADVLNEAAPQMQPQAPQIPQGIPQGIPQQPQMALPENQPGVTQLPTGMPQGMANGGIVSFANRGLVDDEDEDEDEDDIQDARDERKMMEMLSMIQESTGNAIAGIPRDESNDKILRSEKSASSYSINPEEKGEVNKGIAYREPVPSGGERGITANVDRDQARKYNVGNLRPSGFTYPGQVGISGGGFAMFENPEAGIAALNQDIGIKLRRGLDTPLKFISVYAPAADKNDVGAYAGNVSRALGIGPNDRISDTPEARSILASAITRQEGAHKATARFNNGGIAQLSDGIKRYSGEQDSLVGEDPYGRGELMPKAPQYIDDPYAPFEYSPTENTGIYANDPYAPFTSEDLYGSAPTSYSKPQSALERMLARNAQEREEMKAGSKQDAYLALMQAGFGMMAGTSPYMMANLGKGAEQGISTYGALKKQRSADLAALDKMDIRALTAQENAEIKNLAIKSANQRATEDREEKIRKANADEQLRKERLAASISKEASDARETAIARYNSDPTVKKIAAMISEEKLTPGTPEYTWNQQELIRLRGNAMAEAKVPGFKFIAEPAPYPKPEVTPPGVISQFFGKKYTPADLEALKYANENPLDPLSNQIKARFK